MGLFDINNDGYGTISGSIKNYVNNTPDYGIFGNEAKTQIDNAPKTGYDWKTFGKNLAGNLGNMGGTQQTPIYSFNPTMASPGFVANQFNSNPYNSSMLNNPSNNLYNYLTR